MRAATTPVFVPPVSIDSVGLWARLDEAVFVDDEQEFIVCSGRFSGSLIRRDETIETGPQAVLLPEALAWARERATVIVVRVGPRTDLLLGRRAGAA